MCYNSLGAVCLSAWQTDSWSGLSKNKFHLSEREFYEIVAWLVVTCLLFKIIFRGVPALT